MSGVGSACASSAVSETFIDKFLLERNICGFGYMFKNFGIMKHKYVSALDNVCMYKYISIFTYAYIYKFARPYIGQFVRIVRCPTP